MKEMQSNTPQNEWVQYTFQMQFVVLSHKDQDKMGTFGCNHNQMSQKSTSGDSQNSIKIVIMLDVFCGATLMSC